jgi:lycopene beta-cyclase
MLNPPTSSPQKPAHFDYIILGAGCSGLSLVVRLIATKAFSNNKILIIDKAPKDLNDRTWCFWKDVKSQPDVFDSIIHHHWNNLWVRHPEGDLALNISPYSYHLIKGVDFYRYCFQIIQQAPNVHLHYSEVTAVDAEAGVVQTANGSFSADYIFSSVLLEAPQLKHKEFYLLQHFRGWWIETELDVFESTNADLMNFHTSQRHGCAFVYVLPITKRKALVEYTLFSETILQNEEYDLGLQTFMSDELKLSDYKITEVENGVIPMTNFSFSAQQGKVFFIGTAGGQTKASTGYTFQFIQKQSAFIVNALLQTGKPAVYKQPTRFNFYDSVLLRVLKEKKLPGDKLFYRMFLKNTPIKVLNFLDNETTLWQEIQIMNTTDKSIFIPAAIKQL